MPNPDSYTADQILNLSEEELRRITRKGRYSIHKRQVAVITATMKEMQLPESIQETVKALIEDFQP